ncbi:MAG: hypothetical protein C5B58_07410 [Acidobacteria bacterium]|nr:MAG: hypothetical protein C5B58_07410 [Acidobacteriota bacterium]
MKAEQDKPEVRVGRLHTRGKVLHELGRLYRAGRMGRVSPQNAAALAKILEIALRGFEAEEIAGKLAELEARIGGGGQVLQFPKLVQHND